MYVALKIIYDVTQTFKHVNSLAPVAHTLVMHWSWLTEEFNWKAEGIHVTIFCSDLPEKKLKTSSCYT